jgi:sigma-B regulation protein RsbU (phosphoserine phosphatase)
MYSPKTMTSILVVDDDPTVRINLQKSLCRVGYTVYLASSGTNGLAKAQECLPDIIVCSYKMRDMDGLHLCQQIRAIPQVAQTYFILLTGQMSESSMVQAGWLLQKTSKTKVACHISVDDFIAKYPRIQEIDLESRVRCGVAIQQAKRQLIRQQEQFADQLNQAKSYVYSLMPLDLSQGPVQIRTHFQPSHHLGGDGFNYTWLDQDHLLVYLLDVVGHGVLSSMVAVSIINWLNAHGGKDPAEILTSLNQYFYQHLRGDLGQNLYCTVWCGLFHLPSHQLTFATAGHPPAALLYRDHKGDSHLERLTTTSVPIGMHEASSYSNTNCVVPQGSHLCIFSDGIYEFTCPSQHHWGLDQFLEMILNTYTRSLGQSVTQSVSQSLDRLLDKSLDKPLSVSDQTESTLSEKGSQGQGSRSPHLLPAIVQQVFQLMTNRHVLEDDLSLVELYFEG